MEANSVGLLAAGLLLVLLLSGVWIGTALGLLGLLIFFLYGGLPAIGIAGNIIFNQLTSYEFVAIPMFIFMATLLAECGISRRLYEASAAVFGRFPGGLLHANVAGCALFASICGSTIATCAAMSTIALPELEKRGYPVNISLGSLAAAGTLGPMIPPSIGLILYGVLTETSIGKLFIAGILPGIAIAVLFMTYIVVRTLILKDIKPEKIGLKQTILAVFRIWPVLILFLIVLGSIYLGLCTATEAGAIGCTGSFIMAIIFKQLSWKNVSAALNKATSITILIFFILVGAMLFGHALSNYGVPQYLVRLVIALKLTQFEFLTVMTVFYLILGCFMDGSAIKVVTIPIIFPTVIAMGFDAIWFGIVSEIYMEMCAITPPVGVNLFVIQGMTGKPLETIFKGVFPFLLLLLLLVPIITIWPQIALFLPSLMR